MAEAPNPSGQPQAITIFAEDNRSIQLSVTPELLGLFDLTAIINRGTSERFHYSFSGLMIAFRWAKNGISEWFDAYLSRQKVDVAAILRYRNIEEADLRRRIASAKVPFSDPDREYPDGRRLATISAFNWTEFAKNFAQEQRTEFAKSFAQEQGHAWTGLRHMMGAVIFTPQFHAEDLQRWGFDRRTWASSYLDYISSELPDDLGFWRTVNERVFGKEPSPPPEPGPDTFSEEAAASAHIATDSWTVDDKLGHDAYARAIYHFITDAKTEAPLAISIQAPWGGGKTSLMRMVQKELDPKAVETLERERQQRRDRSQGVPAKVEPGKLREEMGAKAIQVVDVLKEIADWKKSTTPGKSVKNPSVPPAGPQSSSPGAEAPPPKHRVTVWFNAWKYQSTTQVWAGLADCILRQVTGRMAVLERQRFWLQLQLSRLDTEKIERRIFEKILSEWWRIARPWALGTIALTFVFFEAILAGSDWLKWVGIPSSLVTVVLGGLKLLQLYTKTKSDVEKEPAELSLGEYLQVPDYGGKVGFIHEVAEDLNRVINAISPNDLPIVVFIDDLDRCSPQKVAEVTEGINLFLAGEFPDCIFVFGMDAEMVAAALEKAHSGVIAKLPAYAAGIPVGWRFMDKFVQLPFVIPPPEPSDLATYIESLLQQETVKQALPAEMQGKIKDLARENGPAAVSKAAADLTEQAKALKLSASQRREVADRLEQAKRLAEIDAEIARASRDNDAVRAFVLQVAPDLYRNPRDLKRFLNTFRLHDFLRIAREGKKLPAPSRELIADWIRLSLRWPQVVRWMHRVQGDEVSGLGKENGASSLGFRLRQLESFAAEVPDSEGVRKWAQLVNKNLGSNLQKLDWVADPALFEFFREISSRPESQRLSYGAGKGLW